MDSISYFKVTLYLINISLHILKQLYSYSVFNIKIILCIYYFYIYKNVLKLNRYN